MSQYSPDVTINNVPLPIEGGNPTAVKVDGSAVTQPVSGTVAVNNFPATQPVSGTVNVGNFPATQPVSGPLTDTQLRATPVPVSFVSSTLTPTTTRVATSASSVVLLAANASRKGFIITTETGTANYVALGATASLTSYIFMLGSSTTLDKSNFPYTGIVSMIRASGSGNVQVTELV